MRPTMARLFLWTALLLLLFGAGQPAGWLLACAAACALGWLLFGPGGHWL